MSWWASHDVFCFHVKAKAACKAFWVTWATTSSCSSLDRLDSEGSVCNFLLYMLHQCVKDSLSKERSILINAVSLFWMTGGLGALAGPGLANLLGSSSSSSSVPAASNSSTRYLNAAGCVWCHFPYYFTSFTKQTKYNIAKKYLKSSWWSETTF